MFYDGVFVEEFIDIIEFWIDELVIIVLGCFFIFENVFLCEGIFVCYIEIGCNVLMYCINIDFVLVGLFEG